MQIRRSINKIQLLRSKYLPDKKRCTQYLVASFDAWLNELPKEVVEKLEEEEFLQVQGWLDERKQRKEEAVLTQSVIDMPRNIHQAIKGIEQYGVTENQAQAIYASIDGLTKTLRKAGFTRSKQNKA